MIKVKEKNDPESCFNKAKDDEMIFVLLARDPAAPAAIRAWVRARQFLNQMRPVGALTVGDLSNETSKIENALKCAERMEATGAVHTHIPIEPIGVDGDGTCTCSALYSKGLWFRLVPA